MSTNSVSLEERRYCPVCGAAGQVATIGSESVEDADTFYCVTDECDIDEYQFCGCLSEHTVDPDDVNELIDAGIDAASQLASLLDVSIEPQQIPDTALTRQGLAQRLEAFFEQVDPVASALEHTTLHTSRGKTATREFAHTYHRLEKDGIRVVEELEVVQYDSRSGEQCVQIEGSNDTPRVVRASDVLVYEVDGGNSVREALHSEATTVPVDVVVEKDPFEGVS